MQNLSQHLEFLNNCNGNWKICGQITHDCGHRRYWRVRSGNKTAILVKDASSLKKFEEISKLLHDFHVPKIYETNAPFALLEDFGDTSLRKISQEKALEIAIDTARNFHTIDASGLPSWEGSEIQQGRKNFNASLEKTWQEIEENLPSMPQIFMHGDFHPDNLMLLPDDKCGLLDFQDAMRGSGAYDVVNLLEDARADISQALRAKMIDRYCCGMNAEERAAFDLWYRVLGTQFHMRVLALFSEIPSKACHLPRLKAYIKTALPHPALEPINKWLVDHKCMIFNEKYYNK